MTLRMKECSDPIGNEEAEEGLTAHQIFLVETGQCPWCGEED